ncbi:SusC/RagA family TonB-linked outer membrane protein [Segetibacter sp. 3557_3]|uniref:SusC/RagA family TonB-linked outer membrane protein n=1 Tax=Segetibacter sp. 3557_3 TaxID=2547429 RepID=UPI001404639C|nr:TonB-dependent receptor [Segetibacter sp. 3557_3]
MKSTLSKKYPLFVLLMLVSVFSYGQSRRVIGKISDQTTHQPLAGVTVSLKGGSSSVTSTPDGSFSIQVPSNDAVITFSYVGYAPQEVKIGTLNTIDVLMVAGANRLEEVVVIGYGAVKRRDLTGAVSTIKNEEIVLTPTHNAVEAMQGRVSGVDITRSSGSAGAGSNILVRGTRSIPDPNNTDNNPNAPLVVIDGFQGGSLSDINPNDIESIDILKDASSTAIYGAQGANGVIIVTTKKGTTGRMRVSYDGFYGTNGYTSFPKPRIGDDYIQLRREAYRNPASGAPIWNGPADDPKLFPIAEEWNAVQRGQWVDWFDLINRNGTQQSHTVSIRSGSERTKAFLSLGYFNEEGMLKRNDFQRFTMRFNLDQNIFKWAKAGILSQVTYTDLNRRRDPLSTALSIAPLGAPYDSAGNINVYPLVPQVLSPLTDERGDLVALDNELRTNVMANAYVELTPLKGLSLRSNLGTTLNYGRRGIFNSATSLTQRDRRINYAEVRNEFNRYFNWDNILTYTRQVSDHSFTLTGIVSYIQSESDNSFATGEGQLLSSQGYFNLNAAQQNRSQGSEYSGWNNLAVAGRLNYSYKSKYLLTLTQRADGASRLAPGNKWDYFPSVAVGWNLAEESFIGKADWLTNLKLRGSWGKAGNYNIRVYGTQSVITPGINIGFGDVGGNLYQFRPLTGSKELGWEVSTTTNVGADFGIFSNRVSGSFEWYNTVTNGILFTRPLPRSAGLGPQGSILQNIGETQNKGVELSLNTRNIVRTDFKWNSTITFTKNKEEITKLPDTSKIIIGPVPETQSLLLGRPVNSFYSYNKMGIWQTDKADLASRYRWGANRFTPGQMMIEDVNGDSIINDQDRTYLGSTVPDFVLGFQNNFTYKNFDLGIFLFWRYGQMINAEFLGRYNPSGEGSGPANLDYWTPENPTNDFPRPRQGQRFIDIPAYQALWFVEGSYFKVKNITLGYTFPKRISGKIAAENIRLYVTGNNVFTRAKSHLVKDYDPERGGAESSPLSRQFVFGLNLGF